MPDCSGSTSSSQAITATARNSRPFPKQEHEVVFLQNFFAELRRRVPVGK
jgi:hypothetical protein